MVMLSSSRARSGLRVILYTSGLLVALGGCGSKGSDAQSRSGKSKDSDQRSAEGSTSSPVDLGTVPRVPKQKLIELLPVDAAGHTRQQPGGDDPEAGAGVDTYSTGWAHYAGTNGSDIRVLINDHPKLARSEKADGAKAGLGRLAEHQLSARDDETTGSELKFVVADRFIVHLTGSAGIPVATLEQVARTMNLNGLSALAEYGYPKK